MIAAGLGYRNICTEEDILAALDKACRDYAVKRECLGMLVTSRIKKTDHAILNAAETLKVPLLFVSYEDLQTVSDRILTHSAISMKVTGSPCLSEAAALVAAGKHSRLLGARIIHHNVTCAIATDGD